MHERYKQDLRDIKNMSRTDRKITCHIRQKKQCKFLFVDGYTLGKSNFILNNLIIKICFRFLIYSYLNFFRFLFLIFFHLNFFLYFIYCTFIYYYYFCILVHFSLPLSPFLPFFFFLFFSFSLSCS